MDVNPYKKFIKFWFVLLVTYELKRKYPHYNNNNIKNKFYSEGIYISLLVYYESRWKSF